MLFIGEHGIARFNEGDQIGKQHLGKAHAALMDIVALGHAVAHDDDHFLHPALMQQPVRDAAHVALVHPARFVFPVAVLQVQNGVFLRGIKGGGRVHQADFLLARHGGGEIMPGHRAVGDIVQGGPFFLAGHRDIQEIHGTAAAVADGQIGAQHVAAIDFQEEILKAPAQIHRAFPHAVLLGGQGMHPAKLIQRHFPRAGRFYAHGDAAIRQNFVALISVAVRFTVIRIEG